MSDGALECCLGQAEFVADHFRAGVVGKWQYTVIFIDHLKHKLRIVVHLQICLFMRAEIELSVLFDPRHTCLNYISNAELSLCFLLRDQRTEHIIDSDKNTKVVTRLVNTAFDYISDLIG